VKELTAEEVKNTLKKAKNDNLSSENTEIAFFGGSFTAIDRSYMVSLLEEAKPFIENKVFSGIRISTRPDAIDEEVLLLLKKYGVTAIELGAQSMNDEVLLSNRRGHTVDDVVNASLLIKKHGFSLGLQMMTGLYKSTREIDVETAKRIVALKPDTVRIYPTIVLENTHLAELLKSGEYKPEELEGRKIIVIANLAPARITGVTSEGMLLAATNNACGCKVILVDDSVPEGTALH
jgi:histone acetyltransferase (RNA polymerase elongator complex component)